MGIGVAVWRVCLKQFADSEQPFSFSNKDGGKDRRGETNVKSIEQQERLIASLAVPVNSDNLQGPDHVAASQAEADYQ